MNLPVMKRIITVLMLLGLPLLTLAQDDLLGELEKNSKDTEYAVATFKGTRLVNGHTVETKGAGSLEFIFMHRFGAINDGWYELYGLDQAYVRLALDYGITDNLSVSIGRNSVDKTMDGYLKYKFLKQSSGVKNFPVTITALAGAAYKTSPKENSQVNADFQTVDRLSYTGQLLIARKFTSNFSLQIMPTMVHKNFVFTFTDNQGGELPKESNDQFFLGIGGRLKLTKGLSINTEYYQHLNPRGNSGYADGDKLYNSLGFGIDIETGGHVFQLILTNTRGLTERAFLTETTDDFFAGDIHLGFNVTRTFQIKKKRTGE